MFLLTQLASASAVLVLGVFVVVLAPTSLTFTGIPIHVPPTGYLDIPAGTVVLQGIIQQLPFLYGYFSLKLRALILEVVLPREGVVKARVPASKVQEHSSNRPVALLADYHLSHTRVFSFWEIHLITIHKQN